MYARTVLISAALLSLATASHARTPRDQFLHRLEKYAVVVGTPKVSTIVDAIEYGKMACVCTEEGSLHRGPGFLVVGEEPEGLRTRCAIPSFDENGALELAAGCTTFVPLAR